MKRLNLSRLRSDEGYSLGLVVIFVMAVGTVLGSVMMATQISADAQGDGVGQLKSANSAATAVADVIEMYRQEADASYALQVTQNQPNCGFETNLDGVKVNCELLTSSTPSLDQTSRITFTVNGAQPVERFFTVTVDPNSGTQSVSQSRT